MRRHLLALTLIFAAAAPALAEPKAFLQYPNSPIRDVLAYYASASNRKVWVSWDVDAVVNVRSEQHIPLSHALALIRTVLLQKHGIEIRDTDTGETYVSWSTDPKLKPLREATIRDAKQPPPPSTEDKRRIRVINK